MPGASGSKRPVDAMAGETFGKYVVIKRLAMGGMAEVCLAKLEGAAGFNKLVVVKQVLPSLASDSNFVEMFLDEGRLAARLTHANIAQTFELGEEAGRYFIAMEYVPGESLFGLLKRSKEAGLPVPQGCVLRIVMQLLDALDYAHALRDERGALLNLVHRDVTPSNVMVTYHGGVKLLDFGIAKAVTQTHRTEAGRIKGKGGYMSPEQCRGTTTLDGRADIYAVGSVLYQLVTGTRPFDHLSSGGDMLAVLHATMEGKFSRPGELRPDLAPEMERIILKAMALDRDQRYRTAGEMLDDLERYAPTAGVFPGPRELSELMRRLFPERVDLARSAELSGDAASAAALASADEGSSNPKPVGGRDTASPGVMRPTTGEDASPFLSGPPVAARGAVPTRMDSPASQLRLNPRPSHPAGSTPPRVSQPSVRGPAASIPRASQPGARGPTVAASTGVEAPTGPQPPRPAPPAPVGLGSGPDDGTALLPSRAPVRTAGKSNRDLPMAEGDEPEEARTVIASEMQVAGPAASRPAAVPLGSGTIDEEPNRTVLAPVLRPHEPITSPLSPVLHDEPVERAVVREEPSLLTAARLPGGLKPVHVVFAVGAICLVLIGMLLGWNARQEQALPERRGAPAQVPRTEAPAQLAPAVAEAPPAAPVAAPSPAAEGAAPADQAATVPAQAEAPVARVEVPLAKAPVAKTPVVRATSPARVERPPAAPARKRSSPEPKAEAQPTGTLKLDAYPWAKVTWKGKELGVTPLNLQLSPGDYELQLENPVSKVKRQVRVTVKARAVTTHFEKLAP